MSTTNLCKPLVKSVYQKNNFSYFSSKTYNVGTQKKRLIETGLLSTQKQMLQIMGKKIFTI